MGGGGWVEGGRGGESKSKNIRQTDKNTDVKHGRRSCDTRLLAVLMSGTLTDDRGRLGHALLSLISRI